MTKIPLAADTRLAGIILAAGSLVSIAFMLHHPHATSATTADVIHEVSGFAELTRFVHGGLIAVILAYLYAFTLFFDRLKAESKTAIPGLIVYVVSAAAFIVAALISGFITPDLAERYAGLPPRDQTGYTDLVRLTWAANQALAKLGTLAMAAAMAFWGIGLVRLPGSMRVIGVLGLVLGLLIGGMVLSGMSLDVKGMTAVAIGFAIWNISVAWALFVRKI